MGEVCDQRFRMREEEDSGNCVGKGNRRHLHEGEMKNPHARQFDDVGNRDFALEPWNWDPDCIVDPDGRTECDERFNLAIE